MTTQLNYRVAADIDPAVIPAPAVISAPAGLADAVGPASPVLDVLRTMRAMRRLSPEPLDREVLKQLVQAAVWAPNAMNYQAYSYVVVTDHAVMAELAQVWRGVHRRYMAVTRRLGIVKRSKRASAVAAALKYQAENFHLTPALIAVCYQVPRKRSFFPRWLRAARAAGPRFAYHYLRARTATLAAAGSAYPAAQNLLLTARSMGLAANLTSWHLYDEVSFRRVLGLPNDVRIFGLIPVGRPLGRFGPVRRWPVETVLRWDRW